MIEPVEYLYRPVLRPVSFASMPSDITWDYVEAPADTLIIAQRRSIPISRHLYGIIATNRPFTPEERQRYYGMEPV